MKKFLLFFTKPIIGGALSLIGLLEILFSIPSSYFTYQISLWIIVLAVGIIILFYYFWKRIKILYYIKTYTSDSFEVLICISGIGSDVHFIQMFTDIFQIVLTLWKRQN